jgi:hypothetical protein
MERAKSETVTREKAIEDRFSVRLQELETHLHSAKVQAEQAADELRQTGAALTAAKDEVGASRSAQGIQTKERLADQQMALESAQDLANAMRSERDASQKALEQAVDELEAVRRNRLEADRRRMEMGDAARSAQGQSDVDSMRLKRALVVLKRKLDREREAKEAAQTEAAKERHAAAQARLAAEPRIRAWKAAMVDSDPDTVCEIEDE